MSGLAARPAAAPYPAHGSGIADNTGEARAYFRVVIAPDSLTNGLPPTLQAPAARASQCGRRSPNADAVVVQVSEFGIHTPALICRRFVLGDGGRDV